jgi:hypothetical protein
MINTRKWSRSSGAGPAGRTSAVTTGSRGGQTGWGPDGGGADGSVGPGTGKGAGSGGGTGSTGDGDGDGGCGPGGGGTVMDRR